MIKTYSELDLKSPGCYGFCPIYNSCDTCYSKDLHLVNSASASLSDDPAFMDKFDSASGCKLPVDLKKLICKAIKNHCLSSGLRLDLDVTALSSQPSHLISTFTKL